MTKITLFPMSRLKWLFLAVIFAVIFLSFLSTAVAEAGGCLYQAGRKCVDSTTNSSVLQRHFVIKNVDDCQRIYDVWTTAERPDIFDKVLQPIRFDSPDLQRYNNQFLIRASGEIGERDLKGAIRRGLVSEVSRTVVGEGCIIPVMTNLDLSAYEPAGAPPWQVTEISATPVLTTYVHLQLSAPGDMPVAPSKAEQSLVPEGMFATWIAADGSIMQALIEYLNLT